MIVEPIRKKQTGKIYTNVELNNIFYEKLCDLRDGKGAKNQKERENMEDDFLKICGGSRNANEVMEFMRQIHDCKDDYEAQRMLERGLLPVLDK